VSAPVGVVVSTSPRGTRTVRLSDGQEVFLSVAQAAALLTALAADGEVHTAWLHGRAR
jgi:hypothetical protein